MFISLEGIDGAGKTTLAGEFTKVLRQAGRRVTFLRKANPPTVADPHADRRLRELATQLYVTWKEVPSFSSFGDLHCILANASYYALLDTCIITPVLRRGEIVIVDGWFYKLLVRVSHNDEGSLRDATSYFQGIRIPDRVILLDVSPEVVAARVEGFTGCEAGTGNFGKSSSPEDFIAYQTIIARSLRDLALRNQWDIVGNQHSSILRAVESIYDIFNSIKAEFESMPIL
jgi:thymidylate kinase